MFTLPGVYMGIRYSRKYTTKVYGEVHFLKRYIVGNKLHNTVLSLVKYEGWDFIL